jgi:hypothetical protein
MQSAGAKRLKRGVREKPSEKPSITHLIVAIGFDLGILIALDFNKDEFMCTFSCVHNG